MPKISVVIPTRDVGEYVGAVLADLRGQIFTDFEALIVDDGSVDDTAEVVNRIVERDHRFLLLSSGGAGVSAARNLGVDHARGEFLAFVDADDRISPEYLRALHESAAATGSDLVSCNADRLEGSATSPSMLHRHACARPQQRTHLSRYHRLVWDTTVWNKLWRRTMWDRAGIRYSDGRWLNDLFPSIQGHVASYQVDVLGDVLYYWRVRTDPTTSITDRRLTDPAARLKSFDDRMFAIEQARELLATQLPTRAVLDAFDHRMLHNDLPIYLPYYTGADEAYQRLVVERIRHLLERFDIQPERFRLGALLRQTYLAFRSGDHDRVATYLHPDSQVVASATRRQRTELVLPEPRSQTKPGSTPHGLAHRVVDRLRPGRNGRGRLAAMARIDRIEVDTPAPGQLTLRGTVRIREGRTDVAGEWTAAARLDAPPPGLRGLPRGRLDDNAGRVLRVLSMTTRVTGAHTPVGLPPDEPLHHLLRSGWRPFTASIDLSQLQAHAGVPAWTLGLEVRAGRLTAYAQATLADHVLRSFPFGISIADGTDLVPAADPARRLRLRRCPAPLRLHTAATEPGGVVLHLSTAAVALGGDLQVWFQGSAGPGRPVSVTAGAQARLPLPDGPLAVPAEYELWYRGRNGTGRVRAAPQLRTTRVPEAGDQAKGTEAVIRPTHHGEVVLEVRHEQLDLRLVRAGDPADALVLEGVGDPGRLGAVRIEFRCRWTDEVLPAPIELHPEGWQARLPAVALPGSPAASGRSGAEPSVKRPESSETEPMPDRIWQLGAVTADGGRVQLRVPPELRARLPLRVDLVIGPVRLLLNERAEPVLALGLGQDRDRWPTLRRVQRSTATAGVVKPRPPAEDGMQDATHGTDLGT